LFTLFSEFHALLDNYLCWNNEGGKQAKIATDAVGILIMVVTPKLLHSSSHENERREAAYRIPYLEV
jgi:hypothetical protein